MTELKMYNEFIAHKGNNLQRNNPTDAGLDVKSAVNTRIKPWHSKLIDTGLHIAIPDGYVGILKSRSGLAVKDDIEVGAGVLDSHFRGICKVLLRNFGSHDFEVKEGDRIAQLLIIPICLDNFTEVETLDGLGNSDRQDKGFGSSGI